ncbi:MAG: glutathione S-transferase [Phenylobacterium zucineum]|nr:MAG: glutathione S-transferase [Phenylobacterium zucineum]
MTLYYAGPSPFARKVLVAAHELGLATQINPVAVSVSPVGVNPDVAAANPLGKIPTLVLANGEAIFDSRVIVDYFDSLTDRSLAPRSGAERWTVLTAQAQADGMADAALLARYEAALRPEPLRWSAWETGQMDKVVRGLTTFEAGALTAGDDLTIADIALGCALGYLDFRFAELDWRQTHPRLAAFYAELAKRSSWIATDQRS